MNILSGHFKWYYENYYAQQLSKNTPESYTVKEILNSKSRINKTQKILKKYYVSIGCVNELVLCYSTEKEMDTNHDSVYIK